MIKWCFYYSNIYFIIPFTQCVKYYLPCCGYLTIFANSIYNILCFEDIINRNNIIIMKRLLLPIFICLSLFSATASNRLEVSVLTCSPGEQVYELFGHTALRVSNKQTGMDVVFNYGLFSFDEPNFIWRFVLGETDYLLGATAYQYFISEYAMRGSGVTEQVLNMDSLQAQQLFDNLRINSLLENRKYRYNFLFNSLKTKIVDHWKMINVLLVLYDLISVNASYFAALTSASCNVTPSIVKLFDVLENSLPLIEIIASVPAVTASDLRAPFSNL